MLWHCKLRHTLLNMWYYFWTENKNVMHCDCRSTKKIAREWSYQHNEAKIATQKWNIAAWNHFNVALFVYTSKSLYAGQIRGKWCRLEVVEDEKEFYGACCLYRGRCILENCWVWLRFMQIWVYCSLKTCGWTTAVSRSNFLPSSVSKIL